MERVELEKIVLLASRWRQENKRTGGLVVVYRGDAQGWIDELRDAQHWVPGCVAVSDVGQCWQTIAGDEDHGALMWIQIFNTTDQP